MSVVQASQSARAPLAVSLFLSVMVHAGAVGGVASVFAVRELIHQLAPWLLAEREPERTDEPRSSAEALPPPPAIASDPVIWVKPGIDDAAADARAWIGYKDETEHTAYTSSVDQSAMTPEEPGMRGEAETVAPPSTPVAVGNPLPPAPEPSVAAVTPPAPTENAPPTPTPAEATPPAEARPEVIAPAPEIPNPVETKTEPAPPPPPPPDQAPTTDKPEPQTPAPPPPPVVTVAPEVEPAPEKAVEAEPVEKPSEEAEVSTPEDAPVPVRTETSEVPKSEKDSKKAEPTPPPARPEQAETPEQQAPPPAPAGGTPQPGSRPTPVPAGNPGEKADKEADATSIRQAVEYHNGRVRAGEGIDIKTVKPEFSNFTVLTSLPQIPVVEITFTAKGKVKNVRMVRSSGYKDVDEPILNAVWAWSAKGKKLEALAKQNPNALLKISVRMLL